MDPGAPATAQPGPPCTSGTILTAGTFPDPVPITTGDEEPITPVSGSRSESDSYFRSTGESSGDAGFVDGTGSVPGVSSANRLITAALDAKLTELDETTTTANHFTTHDGTYRKGDYRADDSTTGHRTR